MVSGLLAEVTKTKISCHVTFLSAVADEVGLSGEIPENPRDTPRRDRPKGYFGSSHCEVIFFVSLELNGRPFHLRVTWRRALHGAEWPEKDLVVPRRRARTAQCVRDVEQEVALPVPQIKEGIVKLPFKEELGVDILVPPRHGGARGSCAVGGTVGPTGTSAAAVF